jgi:flavin-dependent dehydrogenase
MYDFIVVGARCAGASVANFLGKYGYSVLLIDKYTQPGPTLSTHIIGETDVYDRLNVREKIESAGAPPLTRIRVDLEGHVFESDIMVTSRALGLRRELLDRFLYEATTVYPNVKRILRTKVRSVFRENEKVTGVICRDSDGKIAKYDARVVIGADGLNSVIAKEVEAETLMKTNENHHAVYYAYFSGVTPLPLPTFEWYWNDEDVILCNPIDQGMHCIAVMIPKKQTFRWKSNVKESFIDRIKRICTLAPRLLDSKVVGKVRGIGTLESYIKKPYGNGWVLVGDASAHLHPITGVGIDNAVCSAEYLADQLHTYMQGKKSWTEAMNEYETLRDERIRPQYEASLHTLSYAGIRLSEEARDSLGMLCTFPSLIKEAGLRSSEVIKLLSTN